MLSGHPSITTWCMELGATEYVTSLYVMIFLQEFVNILSHLLVLASQKFYELLLRKHQRVRRVIFI